MVEQKKEIKRKITPQEKNWCIKNSKEETQQCRKPTQVQDSEKSHKNKKS